MDFFIEDSIGNLEDIMVSTEDSSIKEYLTFVDIQTFTTQYLTSMEYNDPGIRKIGLFSLQRDDQVDHLGYKNNSGVKLR